MQNLSLRLIRKYYMNIFHLLASCLEGDCDLLPPTPERSVDVAGLDEDEALPNKSFFDVEPPWKNSFIRETI